MSTERTIAPPSDKSITHRAFILAGLTRTHAAIRRPLTSADTRSTAKVLRQLGVSISPLRKLHPVRVVGTKWNQPDKTLHCGNSGTTARLLLGALAGHRLEARLDGDSSLRRRPMRRVTGPLAEMGAHVTEERGDSLPLSIRGGDLRSIEYDSPVASAQVKSALLLAGLVVRVPVSIAEPARSRDHTERLLRFLGADIRSEGTRIKLVDPKDALRTSGLLELTVPGDPSAAAFLTGAAILNGTRPIMIEGVCVNPTRTGFIDVINRMADCISVENEREVCGEPVADLIVHPEFLRSTSVDSGEIPSLIDELPVLAVLAARAEGETLFRSVGELRVKESDRLTSLVKNLRALGVDAEASGDDLVVNGTDRPLGGRIETSGDHRISMAFAVLGSTPNVDLTLSETASTGISYPGFFEDLDFVRGNG